MDDVLLHPEPWYGSQVWRGDTVCNWMLSLDDADLACIRRAVDHVAELGGDLSTLGRNHFDFGQLGQRLEVIRDQVLDGTGFAVIRGLPVGTWCHADLVRAYWGIGRWLGDPVSQNAQGHLLGHVIDQRIEMTGATRLYQTNRSLSYHSDSCDIVGLLCLRTAKSGGESSLASAAAIHNILLENDPGALGVLYGQFHCDRFGEIPQGKLPYYPVHIFNRIDGQLVCCGMDPDIRSAQRLEGVAKLTGQQLEALDAFQRVANSVALKMMLQPGDLQFVNNHTVVHARESYQDHIDPNQRRYLLRLWLSSSEGRRLPSFLAERWGNIAPGNLRGGIRVAGATPNIDLNPTSPVHTNFA